MFDHSDSAPPPAVGLVLLLAFVVSRAEAQETAMQHPAVV
jgi:hypothetical protein